MVRHTPIIQWGQCSGPVTICVHEISYNDVRYLIYICQRIYSIFIYQIHINIFAIDMMLAFTDR